MLFSRLAALVLVLASLPAAQACSIAYEDPVGDQDGPDGALDLTAAQAISGNASLLWRVQAVDLSNSTTGVQYNGQLQLPGTPEVTFHPLCALRIPAGSGPDCHLSRSTVEDAEGATARFEFIADLDGRIEDGWLEVEVPYEAMGLGPGDKLLDLRATSQANVGVGETDLTPVVTDTAGAETNELLLCDAARGDPEAAPTEGGPDQIDGAEAPRTDRDASAPSIILLLLASTCAAWLGRRRPEA